MPMNHRDDRSTKLKDVAITSFSVRCALSDGWRSYSLRFVLTFPGVMANFDCRKDSILSTVDREEVSALNSTYTSRYLHCCRESFHFAVPRAIAPDLCQTPTGVPRVIMRRPHQNLLCGCGWLHLHGNVLLPSSFKLGTEGRTLFRLCLVC